MMFNNINKNKKFAFIYGLKHPDTGKIIYVGKTFNPIQRYIQHSYCKQTSKISRLWGKLKEDGKNMVLYIFEMIENKGKEYVKDKERYWIKQMVESGCILLNKVYPNASNPNKSHSL